MIITVAIPTFNRNYILARNVRLLLKQLDKRCKLLIVDNNSDTPVAGTLNPILDEFPDVDIKIIRNTVNIGGNANILRCMELCETEYLWILSDDDPVLPSAIDKIFNYINNYPDSIYFNFSINEGPRSKNRISLSRTVGLLDFASRIDSYGKVLLISSNVYRVTHALKEKIGIGNLYQYSCAPHLLTLLTSLEDDSVCILINESIIDHTSNETTSNEQQGSPVIWAMGMPLLLDFAFPMTVIDQLRKKLQWISPYSVMRQLLLESYYLGMVDEKKYQYQILKRRFFVLWSGPLAFLRNRFFDLLMINPKLGFICYRILYKLIKGSEVSRDNIRGRVF